MSKDLVWFKSTVTLLRISIGSGIQPGYKLEPVLVLCCCYNLVVDLLQEAPYLFSTLLKSDSDSEVKRAEGKKDTWGNPLKTFGCFLQLVKLIKYKKELIS